MTLDDTRPCRGKTDFGALIGLCVQCDCRTRPGPVTTQPPATQNEDGEWWCAERRFGGHQHRLEPVALSAPPNSGSDGVVSVITRRDAP